MFDSLINCLLNCLVLLLAKRNSLMATRFNTYWRCCCCVAVAAVLQCCCNCCKCCMCCICCSCGEWTQSFGFECFSSCVSDMWWLWFLFSGFWLWLICFLILVSFRYAHTQHTLGSAFGLAGMLLLLGFRAHLRQAMDSWFHGGCRSGLVVCLGCLFGFHWILRWNILILIYIFCF